MEEVNLSSKIIVQDIVSRSRTQPIYVSSIEVVGGDSFSNEFFKKLLSPLVDSSDCTFHQLMERIRLSNDKLSKTGVFKTVDISLHSDYTATIPDKIINYNKEKPIATKVVFKLMPTNLSSGDAFLNFNTEDHLNINLDYLNHNFNENAELVQFGVNYNPYKPNEHLLSHAKFLANLNNPSFKFLIDIFNTHQNNHHWQKSSEKTIGGLMGLQYICKNLKVLSGISISKRSIHNIDDAASDDVKFFGGDYIKSSIINQLSYSNLSYLNFLTKNYPNNGFSVDISNEISSNQEQDNVNNNSWFAKSSASFKGYKSFFNGYITAHFFKSLGFIHTPNNKVHISDRFYLGGVNSFRGFSKNAINEDGGLQFYNIGATIYSKIPSFIYLQSSKAGSLEFAGNGELNPLRLYASGLVGNVSENIFQDNSGATSVGFGLKYMNNWANFDIGYFFSNRFGSEANRLGIKDGLQFSVSIGGSNKPF